MRWVKYVWLVLLGLFLVVSARGDEKMMRFTPGESRPCQPQRQERFHRSSFPTTFDYQGSQWSVDLNAEPVEKLLPGTTETECPHADHWQTRVVGDPCKATKASATTTGVDVEWILSWEEKAAEARVWVHEEGQ